MGGFTLERHISLESGRNICSKLIASAQYDVMPLFLSGSMQEHRIFTLPTALLLKDNADDVHDYLLHPCKYDKQKEILNTIRAEAHSITKTYAKDAVFYPKEIDFKFIKDNIDFVFIALHGRPGEDGTLQTILEQYDIPYNGSGIATAALTIDKYATNQLLAKNGFYVAKQFLITDDQWSAAPDLLMDEIERIFNYPMIAKPIDDGCSSGVIKITHRSHLLAYASASFRAAQALPDNLRQLLGLEVGAFFPQQKCFLLEDFIRKDASMLACLETTTGLLTYISQNGNMIYEIFEPSEVLAAEGILSLEEKFLAGEGHNITPARFSSDKQSSMAISQMVKTQLKTIAQTLNLQGYARIDAFVKIYSDQSVEVWVIEVNTLPAMTPATCIFHQAALNGYSSFDFVDKIIQYGFTKRNFSTYSSINFSKNG